MSIVTVSPKFQVVIPKGVRESMSIKSGEKLEVVQYGHRIELIRIKGMESLEGRFKGMNTNFVREED
jgi:AbrB family looped-hinge helix DNA binding protein